MIERPLDFFGENKLKLIRVHFKDKRKPLDAYLIAFDMHLNIVVGEDDGSEEWTNVKFLRGDIIDLVESKPEQKKVKK